MRAIELNGCSGGMAEGFRRAGIEFTWSFDWDADACASYERNLGHRPVRMDIRDVVRMVRGGWGPGPVDLLVADPPCTPYSRAGKRLRTADERDMLEETCELIALLRPRAYLIGNVPGLQDATAWHIVQEHIGGLGRHGYCVADYVQLDAADYGVPQRRIRPFWYGHLEGPCLVWPGPTHAAPSRNGALAGLGLKPWVTCREALAHLPPEEMGRPVRLRWKSDLHPPSTLDRPGHVVPSSMPGNGGAVLVVGKPHINHRRSEPDQPARTLTRNTHSDGALLVSPKHPPIGLDEPATTLRGGGEGHAAPAAVLLVNDRHAPAEQDAPAPTVAAKVRGQGAQVLRTAQGLRTGSLDKPSPTQGTKTDRIGAGADHVMEWPWDRPSTTVARDERIPPPGHHDANSYLSTPNAIVLSERAAAILQGFPEGWVFVGKTKRSRWSQLGQAMPPGLAEPVARAIARQLAAADSVVAKECA